MGKERKRLPSPTPDGSDKRVELTPELSGEHTPEELEAAHGLAALRTTFPQHPIWRLPAAPPSPKDCKTMIDQFRTARGNFMNRPEDHPRTSVLEAWLRQCKETQKPWNDALLKTIKGFFDDKPEREAVHDICVFNALSKKKNLSQILGFAIALAERPFHLRQIGGRPSQLPEAPDHPLYYSHRLYQHILKVLLEVANTLVTALPFPAALALPQELISRIEDLSKIIEGKQREEMANRCYRALFILISGGVLPLLPVKRSQHPKKLPPPTDHPNCAPPLAQRQ